MTNRQRLITALKNEQPDHVPVAPDLSEMIPIRLLNKPSWEMLVYEDPPIWKARADAASHFDVAAFFNVCVPMPDFPKKAIDDAAAGGGFILSTGDQTPRDTPDENILIMKKVAETYGKY